MVISGDKSRNYKYVGDYERNEYLYKWQWEDQRETATPTPGRRAPKEMSQMEALCKYIGDEYNPTMVEVE